MRESTSLGVSASQDLSGAALDYRLSVPQPSWVAEMVTLHFGSATARNYSISVEQGRGIIKDLNDNLWIGMLGSPARRIVIDPGFYIGTTLATEVQTKLNADTSFIERGITWLVVWKPSTLQFTITPSSGTATFFSVNTAQSVRRNSKAGHVMGFEADASGTFLISDTACPNLGSKAVILSGTASAALNVVITDNIPMDVDSALHIDVSSAALTVDYSVKYKITDFA
jgi:hypothetical protein